MNKLTKQEYEYIKTLSAKKLSESLEPEDAIAILNATRMYEYCEYMKTRDYLKDN